MTVKDFIKYRNERIYQMFESGMRQKAIGIEVGLSEQRVKHIIGEMRNDQRAKVPRAYPG